MELVINKVFNLFANCKLVKGHTRGVIYDLQRNNIYPIPLSLVHILEQEGTTTFDKLLDTYGSENEETLQEYFAFLMEKELIFFHDKPELFPPMSDFWDEPFEVTNSIIDFDEIRADRLTEIKQAIGTTPIKGVQIRIFKEVSLEELDLVLATIKPVGLNSLELMLPYSEQLSLEDLSALCLKYPYLFTVTIFNAPEEYHYSNGAFGLIFFLKDRALSEKSCGVILPDFFTINKKTYTESIDHNSCLNRKVSVDKKGNIKNCPSMTDSYGHVSDTSFKEALSVPSFKQHWKLNKDKIHVCKDCEFRYICTDCRAYVENPNDLRSKPLKCGYNPYTGEWTEWAKQPEKKATIAHYQLEELSLKNEEKEPEHFVT